MVRISVAVLALLALQAEVAAGQTPAVDARPNLIVFLTDDQPQASLGCMGNASIRTPNLDRLAAEGVLFTNAFVTTSVCCSSRASLLTGQHMRRHGIEDFQEPLSAEAFARTYPALLRQAGYRTGYVGKFAIGATKPEMLALSLPAQGFDFWYGFPQLVDYRHQEAGGEARYLTTVLTEKAVAFLEQAPADQPFCLTVGLKEPHGPWNYFDPGVPDPYAGVTLPPPPSFERKAYEAVPQFIRDSLSGAPSQKWLEDPEQHQAWLRSEYRLISRADQAVGEIMAALQRSGRDERTVVVFTSDNGDLEGAHGLAGKWLMYEESIRVPLIVRDPRLPAERRGQRCLEMALGIDLAPTLLALAGLSVPESMQGRDLGPLLRAEPCAWREDWYYEHTFAKPPQYVIPRCEGVRTRRWKYTRYTDLAPPYEQLFDLQADPRELANLAGVEAQDEVLAMLRRRCDEYRETLR